MKTFLNKLVFPRQATYTVSMFISIGGGLAIVVFGGDILHKPYREAFILRACKPSGGLFMKSSRVVSGNTLGCFGTHGHTNCVDFSFC